MALRSDETYVPLVEAARLLATSPRVVRELTYRRRLKVHLNPLDGKQKLFLRAEVESLRIPQVVEAKRPAELAPA